LEKSDPELSWTPNMVTAPIAARLSERAVNLRFEDIPERVVVIAKHSLLDLLGVALGGKGETTAALIVDEVMEQGARPEVMMIGRRERTSVLLAALANGTAAHALDYDDSSSAGHCSCTIVPALLAVAETAKASGATFLASMVAGYDVAGGISALVTNGLTARGFHSTGTLGSFGAAAACGKLLDLDREKMAIALGIAACQTAGLQASFGTMCKPLHAGKAAQNGVLSARLAARGFTANPAAVEGPRGFAATHSDRLDFAAVLALDPGDHQIARNMFKYHAACHLTHPAIECALALRRSENFELEDVDAIRIRVNRLAEHICNITTPRSGLEAKFSLRQNVAFALTGAETASIHNYSDENVNLGLYPILRQITSVEFIDDARTGYTEVDVVLKGGRIIRSLGHSLSEETDLNRQGGRLRNKFMQLATPVLGDARSGALAACVDRLEHVDSMAALAALCVPQP
jgi:2-methylcitrate dehydratase PrpD